MNNWVIMGMINFEGEMSPHWSYGLFIVMRQCTLICHSGPGMGHTRVKLLSKINKWVKNDDMWELLRELTKLNMVLCCVALFNINEACCCKAIKIIELGFGIN